MGIADSTIKGVGVVVGVVLLAGAAGGGIVRDPQTGRVDPQASLQRSASIGGAKAGDSVDQVSESFGRGAGSAVTSSRVLQAGALGAAAYYGSKVIKGRTTPPVVSGGDGAPSLDRRPDLTPTPAPAPTVPPSGGGSKPPVKPAPAPAPVNPPTVESGPLAGVSLPQLAG